MNCFLRFQSDTLEESIFHSSIESACNEFLATARELDRFGQVIEASIHIASTRDELHEYPNYVLSLTPEGRLKKERA